MPKIVIDQTIRDRNGGAVQINAVSESAARVCRKGSVMIDPVAIKKDPRAISQKALALSIVNPIASNHRIMKVIQPDSDVAILDLKSFQVDPANCVPITRDVLKKNRISFAVTVGAALNDRELARGVQELDRS